MKTNRWLTPALLLSLLATMTLALVVGSVSISLPEIAGRLARAATGRIGDDTTDRILFSIRLPRVLLAAGAGAALALAGLATQTLFRNPLASPSVIGVSNGAALGAVTGVLMGACFGRVGAVFPLVPGLLGGIATVALVFMLGRRGRSSGHVLLLAGIAIAALCSSLTTAVLYLSGERLQGIVFWLMGGMWQANWLDVWIILPPTLAGLAAMMLWSRDMNVALLGERSAGDLGCNPRRLQRRLLVLIAVLTSVTVSISGVIGFVGLIVPHLLRLVTGADHRRLVPPVALGGALLLVLADTAARTLASPAEIPVGVFTSITGAPFFLWLLQKRRPLGVP